MMIEKFWDLDQFSYLRPPDDVYEPYGSVQIIEIDPIV